MEVIKKNNCQSRIIKIWDSTAMCYRLRKIFSSEKKIYRVHGIDNEMLFG